MATIDYKQLATPEANLIELLAAQNQDGTYTAKLMGSEPFAVLAAKTIYNAYNDIEDNMMADVEGPATSTDNALARFDGTTGKLIQNSNATLTDAGSLSLAVALPVASGGTGVTTSTGSGSNVLSNTPTLVTPNIGAATGTSVNLSGSGAFGGNLTVSGGTLTSGGNSGATLALSGNGSSGFRVDMFSGASGSASNTTYYNTTAAGAGNASYGRIGLLSNTSNRDLVIDTGSNGTGTAGNIAINPGGGILSTSGNLTVSGGTVTSGTGTLTLNSSANTVVLQSAGTAALTLDSSQNATFAGNVAAYGALNSFCSSTDTDQIALNANTYISGWAGIWIRKSAASRAVGNVALACDLTSTLINAATGGSIFFRIANASALTIDSSKNATFTGTVATQGGTASTPASASATGTAGTILWDASYIYVCTAANTWKRVAIATW